MDIDDLCENITLNDLSIEFLLKIGHDFYNKFVLSSDSKKEFYRVNVINVCRELLKRLDLYYYRSKDVTHEKVITVKEYNEINQFFSMTI